VSSHAKLTGRGAQALRDSSHRVVVTGAGGWIGRATLDLLHSTLGGKDFRRRVVAFGSTARVIELGRDLRIEQRPLPELAKLEREPTLLLHLAFLTKDRVAGMSEEDYRRKNRRLSETVLSALDAIGAEGVFIASSGAARHADDPDASPDMRLYGALKRQDERAFSDWAESSGKRAVICRIFALSGPHINKHETYALASFIRNAVAGEPIEIRSDHIVTRSYVAIRELMSLVFALLLDGTAGCTQFDSGGDPMEMQDIAAAVAAAIAPVPVKRPELRPESPDDYFGDRRRYDRLLAANGVESVPFGQQVLETAEFFRASQGPGLVADKLAC
jgi:nucleoside-diphosphate-sugar epimerase